MTDEQKEVLNQAIRTYGEDKQMEMMVEEAAELIQAIQKLKRNHGPDNIDHFLEELADCEILIHQMKIIFEDHNDTIEIWKNKKIARLKTRLEKSNVM